MLEKTSSVPHDDTCHGTRRQDKHEEHKVTRNDRFSRGVYGEVKKPVIPKGVIGIWDPPGYVSSRRTASHSSTVLNDGIDRRLDLRCFYTGVLCDPPPARPPLGWNHDPRILPWLGSRDHLVPARRNVPGCPVVVGDHRTSLVWSSNVANVTLGLSPLPVRLTIRRWMLTVPVDRNDRSVDAGMNMRWLIISMLEEFRIKGRYPWSRDGMGRWWYPEISQPFMERAWKLEHEFLMLGDDCRRDQWIREMSWRF